MLGVGGKVASIELKTHFLSVSSAPDTTVRLGYQRRALKDEQIRPLPLR